LSHYYIRYKPSCSTPPSQDQYEIHLSKGTSSRLLYTTSHIKSRSGYINYDYDINWEYESNKVRRYLENLSDKELLVLYDSETTLGHLYYRLALWFKDKVEAEYQKREILKKW
jgi:hypothetical protein